MNDGGVRATRPAGFWIRFVAALVDGVVVWLDQLAMGLVAARVWGREIGESPSYQGLLALFTLLFAGVYATATHAATGQTIGKALVSVRVVGVDGQLLPAGAALLRWLATFASALPLGMGFVMAGLRADKRALHDLIAGSRVERVREAAAERLRREQPAPVIPRDPEPPPPPAPWPADPPTSPGTAPPRM